MSGKFDPNTEKYLLEKYLNTKQLRLFAERSLFETHYFALAAIFRKHIRIQNTYDIKIPTFYRASLVSLMMNTTHL